MTKVDDKLKISWITRSRVFATISLGLLSLLFCASFSYKIEKDDLCDLTNTSFIKGEQITYKVFYNWGFIWIPAGEVYFNLSEDENSYIVDIKGISYPSYDSVFKVRDRYHSIIDKETLLPRRFLRDIKQGNYYRYDSLVFDQKGYAVTEYYGKTKESAKPHQYELKNCTQDLISVLYHLRNRDIYGISAGDELPVSFFFSKKLYELNVDILGLETKKIKDLGKYDVIHASPELITGSVFDENSHMDVWVSNDGNKIPLLIESPVRIGKVKAVLKEHKNLKFPLVEAK